MYEYTLFIGLADKDSKRQLKSTEHYKNLVNVAMSKEFKAYTIELVEWVYTHDDGETVRENSFKITVFGSRKSKIRVQKVAYAVKVLLNQENIVLKSNKCYLEKL